LTVFLLKEDSFPENFLKINKASQKKIASQCLLTKKLQRSEFELLVFLGRLGVLSRRGGILVRQPFALAALLGGVLGNLKKKAK